MARSRAAGFTLLELLVVVFIVGVIAAMATLGVGNATRDRDARREAERLGDLVNAVGEEAQMQARQFGLTVYRAQYEFSELDPQSGEWRPVADADQVMTHEFVPGTEVDLWVDGRALRLAEKPAPAPAKKTDDTGADGTSDGAKKTDARKKEDKKREFPPPQVFIWSSGEVTPFVLRLRAVGGGPAWELRVTASGKVTTGVEKT